MYLVAVALCVGLSLVDISGAQSCVSRDGTVDLNCGDCTVKGDPEITTYDNHTIGENYRGGITYTVPGSFDAKYAISQLGRNRLSSLFGVSANFKQADQNGPRQWGEHSFVSTVYYNEPGVTVELILPEKAFTAVSFSPPTPVLYCQQYRQGQVAADDTGCATKIKVNGITRVIPDDGSVSSFRGTDGRTAGTVEIFKVGECNSYHCQIIVVGSQGITVSLVVDPTLTEEGRDGNYHAYLYYLNVYAQPSLHGQLYGLCDTFTGKLTDHYTLRDGSLMIIWSEANIKQFIESWKIISYPVPPPSRGFQIRPEGNIPVPTQQIISRPNIRLIDPSGVLTGGGLRNLANPAIVVPTQPRVIQRRNNPVRGGK